MTTGPYGQVIFYDPQKELAISNALPKARAEIVTKFDARLYKQRLEALLRAQ